MSVQALADGGYRVASQLVSWVAAQPGDWDPDSTRDPEWGKAAPAGLLIWLFLGVMLFLLIKSMNKHMRRVPASFDAEGAEAGAGDVGPGDAGSDSAGADDADSDDADSDDAAAEPADVGSRATAKSPGGETPDPVTTAGDPGAPSA